MKLIRNNLNCSLYCYICSNIGPLLPFGFLLIYFSHLCHLIRQLPKSRSSFFLSGLPPHPGLPERFQLEQNCRSLGLRNESVVRRIMLDIVHFQNSNLPTIRIISAGLISDACLETILNKHLIFSLRHK